MKKNLLDQTQTHQAPQRRFRWLNNLILFILIIIAVFLGSWGEHQWQNSITAAQEQQRRDSISHLSMLSICQELGEDSARLVAAISSNEDIIQGTDSLLKYIYSLSYPDSVVRRMYYLNKRYQYQLPAFSCIARTRLKLIAGSLDSVLNDKVRDSLISYAEAANSMYRLWERYNSAQQAAGTDAFGIFDSEYLFPYQQENAAGLLTSAQQISFFSDEPKLLNIYAGKLLYAQNNLKAYIAEMKMHHFRCLGILGYLRNYMQEN